jgi:putative peptide zinc metalloprotease protein
VRAVIAGFVAGVLVLLFVVPAPFRTVVEGVAWLPPSAMVRAGEEGFVTRVVATPGSRVQAGELLVQLVNPALQSKLEVAQGRVAELQAQYLSHLQNDRAQAAMAMEQLDAAQSELATAREHVAGLSLKANVDGVFMVQRPQDLPGRFEKQGDLVGYVIDRPQLVARVVATQDAADVVRVATTRVQVRLAHDPDRVFEGRLQREVPAGEEYLPSRVLAMEGGGQLATDARDNRGDRTLERTFQFDVAVQDVPGATPLFFGQRVHARFEHPPEPIGRQWLRTARRLFLSQFHV